MIKFNNIADCIIFMMKQTQIQVLFFISVIFMMGCLPETEDKKTVVNNKEVENEVLKEDLLSNREYEKGEKIYLTKCADCHKPDGTGVEGSFPPLADTETLTPVLAITAIVQGIEGETEVKGKKYHTPMEKIELSDKETAEVVNYILNSWGNQKGKVTRADIAEFR